MSPRKEDHSLMCSNCKEKTTEIWFSEKGTPLCLICFSTERFEKINETPIGTPRKTLNSNPVLRMCSLIEQKLAPGEKRKRNKSAVSRMDKEEKVKEDFPSSSALDEKPTEKEEIREEKHEIESGNVEVKAEEKEETAVDEGLKKSLRRKKKPLASEPVQQNKKPRMERIQKEKPAADPAAKGRRSIFKQKVFKSPDPVPSIFTSDAIYFKGTYFRKGDVVSLTDIDGGIFYAQLRGFMQDQYCEKSAAITWLLPTEDAPPPEDGFDPDYYIFGPEEDLPRKLEYMTFVMHAPSNYFYDKSLPYPEYPVRGAIYGRLRPMQRVICHTALQKNEIEIPECLGSRQTEEVVEVKDEAEEVEKDAEKERTETSVMNNEKCVNGPADEISSCSRIEKNDKPRNSVEVEELNSEQTNEVTSEPTDVVMSEPADVVMTEPTNVVRTEPTNVAMTEPTNVVMTEPTNVSMTEPTNVIMTERSEEPVSTTNDEPAGEKEVTCDLRTVDEDEIEGILPGDSAQVGENKGQL